MHVAWLIVKIILLTLGILLGLALILLLLFLFVPFRYRLDAVFTGKPDVKLRVSWMSFFLDFRAMYRDNEFQYSLRSFWVLLAAKDSLSRSGDSSADSQGSPETGTSLMGKRKRKKERTDREGKDSRRPGETAGQEIPVIDMSGIDSVEFHWEPELEPWEITDAGSSGSVGGDDSGDRIRIWACIRRFFHGLEFIFTFPARLVEAIYRFWHRIRDVMDYFWSAVDRLLVKLKLIDKKRGQIVKLYKLPTTKTAISNCKGYLFDLLAHLKPKKMTGELTIGLKDPAATGQLFGFLGLLLPIYYDKINLTADFSQERLEGDIHMKGGITIAYLVWMLLKIYQDKYTMKTYERVRRILGGNKDGKRI